MPMLFADAAERDNPFGEALVLPSELRIFNPSDPSLALLPAPPGEGEEGGVPAAADAGGMSDVETPSVSGRSALPRLILTLLPALALAAGAALLFPAASGRAVLGVFGGEVAASDVRAVAADWPARIFLWETEGFFARLTDRRSGETPFPPLPANPSVPRPSNPDLLPGDDPLPSAGGEGWLPIKGITVTGRQTASYDYYDGIYIRNNTKERIDIKSLLESAAPPDLSGGGPQVLIFSTHSTEAFTPPGQDSYDPDVDTRSTDPSENVLEVGAEIERILSQNGIETLRETTLFDYPSYSGSYTRSLARTEEILKQYPSIKIVIDVHRDGMLNSDGTKYKLVSPQTQGNSAQIMMVVGTDKGGLPHTGWKDNLSLALLLQQSMNQNNPTLARPISLTNSRYNQHLTPGCLLVEFGTDGNTLDEARLAGRLFAENLAAVLSADQ